MRPHNQTVEVPQGAVNRGWRSREWLWRVCARLPVSPRLHVRVYRLTGGVIGSRLPISGLEILLLTTTGRVTGRPRTTPVIFFRQGEALVIVASNRGTQRYPQWYWNLQCHPEARIQVRRTKQAVIAREARTIEHEALWPLLRGKLPVFDLYQGRTPRHFPVIILHPTPPAGSDAMPQPYLERRPPRQER